MLSIAVNKELDSSIREGMSSGIETQIAPSFLAAFQPFHSLACVRTWSHKKGGLVIFLSGIVWGFPTHTYLHAHMYSRASFRSPTLWKSFPRCEVILMSANRPAGSPERIQEGCRVGEKGLGFLLGRQLVGSGKDLQMVRTNHGRTPCSSWLWGLTLQTQTEAGMSKIRTYGETVEGTRQQGPTSCTSRNGEWRLWRRNGSRVWRTPVFPLLGSLGVSRMTKHSCSYRKVCRKKRTPSNVFLLT